jgi:TonB family protein
LRQPGPQPKDVASVMSNTLAQAHDHLPPSDRRLNSRQPIRTLAYVALDEGNGGIVLNISEGGFSVQAVTSLMEDLLPGVRFQLSESEAWIEANARITWTSESRKLAGLEFVDLPEDTRSRIREWLVRESLPAGIQSEAGAPVEEETASAPEPAISESAIPTAPIAAAALVVEDHVEEQRHEQHADATPLLQSERAVPVAVVSPAASVPPVTFFTRIANTARESEPLPTTQEADTTPGFAARLFRNNWALAGLVALLAIGSLAAGWAAGEGAFGKFLQRAQKLAPENGATLRDIVTSSVVPVTRISEIEIENASNQRWTIPFDGPLNNPEEAVRRQTSGQIPSQARKALAGFRTWILTPPVQTQKTADAGEPVKEIPPPLPNTTSGSENILSSSGSINSQNLAAPPALRVPEALPATVIVKQGHVISRIDPTYPTLARNERVEGTVRLNVTVGTDGTVRGVALLGGPRLLVEAAEAAVRQWRYAPSTVDGRPVEFQQEVDLRFHLSNAAR